MQNYVLICKSLKDLPETLGIIMPLKAQCLCKKNNNHISINFCLSQFVQNPRDLPDTMGIIMPLKHFVSVKNTTLSNELQCSVYGSLCSNKHNFVMGLLSMFDPTLTLTTLTCPSAPGKTSTILPKGQ